MATSIVVFVDRLSKKARSTAVPDYSNAVFPLIFYQHKLPVLIVSDREPRLTGKFWTNVLQVLGSVSRCTRLIIHIRIVKPSALIALSKMYFQRVCQKSKTL